MSARHEGRDWESHHDADLFIRRYFHDLSALVPNCHTAASTGLCRSFFVRSPKADHLCLR